MYYQQLSGLITYIKKHNITDIGVLRDKFNLSSAELDRYTAYYGNNNTERLVELSRGKKLQNRDISVITQHNPYEFVIAREPENSYQVRFDVIDSPFGPCLVGWHEDHICHLSFIDNDNKKQNIAFLHQAWPHASYEKITTQTLNLFNNLFTKDQLSNTASNRVKLLVRGSALQLDVWRALTHIPHGETVSYSAIAQHVGKPKAIRAVASAIGQNQISYLIPCHRVIRSDGSINKYRWGSVRKTALLFSEQTK